MATMCSRELESGLGSSGELPHPNLRLKAVHGLLLQGSNEGSHG